MICGEPAAVEPLSQVKFRSSLSGALAALAMSWACPASAGEGRVDQGENLEIEEATFELESQLIFVPASNGEAGEWKFAPTVEYGINDALAVGLEIEFEKETGETLQFSEIGLQAKLILADPEVAVAGLGVQSTVIFDRSGRVGFETYLIVEHTRDEFNVLGNLIVSGEPGDWSALSTSYVGRFDHAIDSNFAVGIEAGGELSGDSKGRHWVGPVLQIAADEASLVPSFELSAFAPLSRKTPDFQVRLELDWEF